jgi:iron complex outermembrane receptor protein
MAYPLSRKTDDELRMRAHAPSLVIAAALCCLIASLGTAPPASAVEEAPAQAEEEAPAEAAAEEAAGADPQAEAEAADMPDTALAQDEKIEQLYVTATKREESLQDVPISMAALDSSFLEAAGTTRFLQLQQYGLTLRVNFGALVQ